MFRPFPVSPSPLRAEGTLVMADTAPPTTTTDKPVKASDERDAQTPVPVEQKTPPNDADLADDTTLAKSYLVAVDDSSVEPSDELIKRQYNDMRQTAMQRGLRPLGDPVLAESKADGPKNLLLRYTLDVVSATKVVPEGAKAQAEAVDVGQGATGEKLRREDKRAARTVDGKNVDTTSPESAENPGGIPAQLDPEA